MVQTCVHFILVLSWIQISDGLRCPSCTYLTTDENIPAPIEGTVDTILREAPSPECAQTLREKIPEITEEECEDISGKVPRCIYYKVSVTATISLRLMQDVSVRFQLHKRGCTYFNLSNLPFDGCLYRNTLNEDATIINWLIGKRMNVLEVADFQGTRCVCSESYCSRKSTTSAPSLSTVSSPSETAAAESTTTSSASLKGHNCNAVLFLAVLASVCLSYMI